MPRAFVHERSVRRLKSVAFGDDTLVEMRDGTQWVAFRSVPGAMLKAPLPSASEVGEGWRGVALRRVHPLDQFDALLEETGVRSDAAIGIHVEDDYTYAVATARGSAPIRLVVGVPVDHIPSAAAEAAMRCDLTGTGTRWAKQTATGLAAWSAQAPRCSEAAEIGALLGVDLPGPDAAGRLVALFGISFPEEAIPDPLSLQSVARDQLAGDDEIGNRRRRWFSSAS